MANFFWTNNCDVPAHGAVWSMLWDSKSVSYISFGLLLVSILCLVHILTTFYEQGNSQPWAKSLDDDFWLVRKEKKLAESVSINKREISARIKLDIEKKFNQSLMNKTYSFPRSSS